MKADGGTLMALAGHFALMSLFAVGGANSAIPEMQRLAVDVMQWMSDRQFNDMFAIAQVTPGPNVIIVTLIGYHVAGLAGALVTTLAMCGPTCVFAVIVARAWERFKDKPWRNVIGAALAPVSIGLLAASALVIASVVERNVAMAGLIALAAGVIYFTRLNPLWLFALAALLGGAGIV
ncbi:MAG: chromate transporter [Proteobacteria bacterium]|nr:chromate transporter [Pseudomonadota bacterium]